MHICLRIYLLRSLPHLPCLLLVLLRLGNHGRLRLWMNDPLFQGILLYDSIEVLRSRLLRRLRLRRWPLNIASIPIR